MRIPVSVVYLFRIILKLIQYAENQVSIFITKFAVLIFKRFF